jgi:hypothetical protein
MSDKCIVFDCDNVKGQGSFIGDLCAPCHQYLTGEPTSKKQHSQAWRNAVMTGCMYESRRQEIVGLVKALEKLTDIQSYPTWIVLRTQIIPAEGVLT